MSNEAVEVDVVAAEPVALEETESKSTGPVPRSDFIYLKVAAVLAVLTVMEVALPELVDNGRIYGPALIILMSIKFYLVASFFMHLRHDNPMLSRVFYAGLGLALAVYLATLSSMLFWKDSGNSDYDDPPQAITPTTAAPATG